jgi:hypothetical protein
MLIARDVPFDVGDDTSASVAELLRSLGMPSVVATG